MRSHPPRQAGEPITLRPARVEDAAFVVRLTEASMRASVEQTWGQWREDRRPFRAAAHRIVQLCGQDIGCLALQAQAHAIWLHKLYLLPAYQRRGIGALLLRIATDDARAKGKPLRLRVLRANPACAFYRRAGFVVMGSTPERLVMEWRPRGRSLRYGPV